MAYRFIKIKGKEGRNTGYYVPRMYQLVCSWPVLKTFGLSYVKERLNGYTIWWVDTKEDFDRAIKTLDELKKTRLFGYRVM